MKQKAQIEKQSGGGRCWMWSQWLNWNPHEKRNCYNAEWLKVKREFQAMGLNVTSKSMAGENSAGSGSWKLTQVAEDSEGANGVWRGCPDKLKLCNLVAHLSNICKE